MTIFKYCNNCKTESEHYTKQIRCIACAKASALRSKEFAKERARERIFNKKARDLAAGIVQPRQFNLMAAPVYTGEKWADVRGQMRPTTIYVSAGVSI